VLCIEVGNGFCFYLYPALFGAALLFRLLVSLMYTFGSEELFSIVQGDEEDGVFFVFFS
jgi:hypothetical protein